MVEIIDQEVLEMKSDGSYFLYERVPINGKKYEVIARDPKNKRYHLIPLEENN